MIWEHCPHYMVGPADMHGVGICEQCGSAVQLRLAGLPVDEFHAGQSTVIAREGDDVAWVLAPEER